jgi:hypothetical protein
MKSQIYFVAALAAMIACGLSGCAHREKTAPCSPLSYAATNTVEAGPWIAVKADPCGQTQPVNPDDGNAE